MTTATKTRKPTQQERIIELLSDHRWHSTVELNAIAWRYGAILHVLRNNGYVFEKEREGKIEHWRLIRAGGAACEDVLDLGVVPPGQPEYRMLVAALAKAREDLKVREFPGGAA